MSRMEEDPRLSVVQLSARPVGGPTLRDVVAGVTDPVAAERVADALTEPAVIEELAWVFTRALSRAADAGTQRDDIFEWPGHAETAGRVAADALREALGRPASPTRPCADEAKAILADVTYLDWRFDYVDTPFPRVTVTARLPDTSEPGKDFTVNRYAVVEGDVVGAAFRAVMDLHDHEAREHFFYRGRRVFNSHLEQDESSGPIRRHGAVDDTPQSYTADIGPSAGVRARPSADQ